MYSSTAWRAAAPAGSQIGRPAPTSGSVWNSSSSRPSRWWSIILGSPSPLEGRRAHHPVREAAPERCAPRGPVKLRSQSGHARPRRDSARRRAQIRATHGFHGIRRRFAGATSLPSLPARRRAAGRPGGRAAGRPAATMPGMEGWRARYHRYSTRLYRPSPHTTWLSWIGDERLAIGNLPTGATLSRLPEHGVTHIVNCRATAQTWLSQDLAAERALLGPSRVVHAPMWDFGQAQAPRLWSAAAHFAVRVLDEDPEAGVLIHCQQGRRRSILLAYAVLRLHGHTAADATALISRHRAEAKLVDAYTASVEQWLAAGADPIGQLRIR